MISPPKRSSCPLRSELALAGCTGCSRIAVVGAGVKQHGGSMHGRCPQTPAQGCGKADGFLHLAWLQISLPHQPHITQHKHLLSTSLTFFTPPPLPQQALLPSDVRLQTTASPAIRKARLFSGSGGWKQLHFFFFSGLGLKPTTIILPSSQIRQVTMTKPI